MLSLCPVNRGRLGRSLQSQVTSGLVTEGAVVPAAPTAAQGLAPPPMTSTADDCVPSLFSSWLVGRAPRGLCVLGTRGRQAPP